ncbi:MAG: DNA repair protein RecN [Alphaproteobacteria bacterium]|nr:DNA repair protein RecN [Alphaproteobacteria bacterium]MBU0795669.1 DNA repair protein RecN [Alphaproteobacteria bacterium]MBU0887292.1 DNA repair protein RecN [Alphaproteobacteria bacterium]MBU1811827.1 DNA repair protein RecN [Alphaproteobacteria bacterium]MBU2091737.1 DNA repair protein RecN [Alphaproteobacteria bacterium]
MLTGLAIRDVVLIDRLELGFRAGLSVLTGETGAGKSILLDALGLALGARGDSGLVRHGAEQASVAATFEIAPSHPAFSLLAEQGLEPDSLLILRRILSADGRSRAFANDQPISIGLLRRLGDLLVEVHGQFDDRGLLDPTTHREALDSFGTLQGQVEAVRQAFRNWRQAAAAEQQAVEEGNRARADETFLRHSVEELDALSPEEGEEDRLAEQRSLMMNAEQIAEALSTALALLDGDRGVESGLAGASRQLGRVVGKTGDILTPALAALDRATAETQEAVHLLQSVTSDMETDPAALAKAEERLYALRDVARKHGVEVNDLPALRGHLAAQLAAIDDSGDRLARLAAEAAAARTAYLAAATALHEARTKAATRLDKAVSAELPPLKLEKARFQTRLDPLEESGWGADGIDRITFAVATNPGLPPGPINKIASGGELSRFMLALKVVLSQASPVPTLVFDEVDSGIGGATADAVGERLARLGGDLQVLVITHSPQVAARGSQHLRVEKRAARDQTTTTVVPLGDGERREEIARMLSGAEITNEARAAADRLMTSR